MASVPRDLALTALSAPSVAERLGRSASSSPFLVGNVYDGGLYGVATDAQGPRAHSEGIDKHLARGSHEGEDES